MAVTLNTSTYRDFDVQILTDVVKGVFAGRNAFMGSILVSQGAITTESTMPHSGPDFIGSEITMPYFGVLGEFEDNPEGSSSTPKAIFQTNEKATIARQSLSFEVSRWARNSSVADPYVIAAEGIRDAATRAMDKVCITEAAGTPLVTDVYVAGAPSATNLITWNGVCDARALWGDEDQDAVAIVAHSRTVNDMRKQTDLQGRPLVLDSFRDFNIPAYCGLPVITSDRMPLTGSSMTTPTSAGATPPVLTLTGVPTGPWNLAIKTIVGGAHTTATIQFSTDGGNTWSATLTTLGAGVALSLVDTAKDSLVGNNGTTGISAAFAAGTFAVPNSWASKTNMKATTLILRRGALGYWYNAAALQFQTDKNILADTDIAAMHLYHAAKRYRRSPKGVRPGVVALKHNVSGFSA